MFWTDGGSAELHESVGEVKQSSESRDVKMLVGIQMIQNLFQRRPRDPRIMTRRILWVLAYFVQLSNWFTPFHGCISQRTHRKTSCVGWQEIPWASCPLKWPFCCIGEGRHLTHCCRGGASQRIQSIWYHTYILDWFLLTWYWLQVGLDIFQTIVDWILLKCVRRLLFQGVFHVMVMHHYM